MRQRLPARSVSCRSLRSASSRRAPWSKTEGRSHLGVLAGELGRVALQPLLLALKARFARPGAIQLVADLHREPAQAVDFELHGIAVLQRRQTAMVGAGGDEVARLQIMDARDPFDAARDLVR